MVHPAGIEPTAFAVGGRHSIQLRYECIIKFNCQIRNIGLSVRVYIWVYVFHTPLFFAVRQAKIYKKSALSANYNA